eukprot:gene5168-10330_t
MSGKGGVSKPITGTAPVPVPVHTTNSTYTSTSTSTGISPSDVGSVSRTPSNTSLVMKMGNILTALPLTDSPQQSQQSQLHYQSHVYQEDGNGITTTTSEQKGLEAVFSYDSSTNNNGSFNNNGNNTTTSKSIKKIEDIVNRMYESKNKPLRDEINQMKSNMGKIQRKLDDLLEVTVGVVGN